VDEFRIGPAETYDVIVEPEDRAYTLFAESIGRSGYTRGTLAPRPGMSAPVPKMRPRPIRTMADMGMEMSAMGGGKGPHAGHSLGGMGTEKREKPSGQAGMEMSGMPGPSTASGRMAVPGVRLLAPDGSYLSLPSMGLPGMKKPGKPMPAMPGMDHGGATKPGRGAPESKPMPAMPGMDHGGAAKPGRRPPETKPMPADHGDAAKPGVEQKGTGQEHSGHAMGAMPDSAPEAPGYMHGGGAHGVGNSTAPMSVRSRMGEPGIGLEDTGSRVLVYTDLKSLTEREDQRPPSREIELHITGNMERFVWGFNGKKYSQSGPVRFNYGERVRLILVNDTMMEHPIHLHGMWMEAENGAGRFLPRKHTVTVKPAERFPVLITADAPGHWAMHCHLLLHMEMGMFRVVEVIEGGDPEVINGDPGPRPTPVRENIAMNRRLSARPPYGEGTASHE
jgi:FtsP/CotA-like multicopper oxidase with cupredoxin domain